MGELSPWHWAVVIGIAVLLFGAKRLPDAARSLGRSARILRAELHGQSPVPDAALTPAPVVAPVETQDVGQQTTVAQAPTPG